MIFTTNRDHFSAALRKCVEMAHKQTMPILGCVLLRVTGDQLSISATTLDMWISATVKIEAGKDGAVCLNARQLLSVVDNCRELEVVLEVKQGTASISSGKSKFKIAGMDAAEFPAMPEVVGEKVSVEQPVLVKMLKATEKAASVDYDNRRILCGVYFQFREDKLTLVATDGRRLAETTSDAKADEGSFFILPDMALPHLKRILGFDGDAIIRCDGKMVSFACSLGTLWSKVIEGNFPNYKQVIPKYETPPIKIERELLKECVERGMVGSYADDKILPKIQFRFTKGELECSAMTAQRGESMDSLAIDYDGPDVTLNLNPHYLLDCLASVPDDLVGLNFRDELSPLVITGIAFLSVIMVMKPAA